MNFRPESGYEVAVRVFRALGVPIQDKNTSEHGSHSEIARSISPQHFQPRPSYPALGEESQMKTE